MSTKIELMDFKLKESTALQLLMNTAKKLKNAEKTIKEKDKVEISTEIKLFFLINRLPN